MLFHKRLTEGWQNASAETYSLSIHFQIHLEFGLKLILVVKVYVHGFLVIFIVIGPCDECKMMNGIGYNPHPEDCDKFTQCYFGDTNNNDVTVYLSSFYHE
jgi:hypothetical protein